MCNFNILFLYIYSYFFCQIYIYFFVMSVLYISFFVFSVLSFFVYLYWIDKYIQYIHNFYFWVYKYSSITEIFWDMKVFYIFWTLFKIMRKIYTCINYQYK